MPEDQETDDNDEDEGDQRPDEYPDGERSESLKAEGGTVAPPSSPHCGSFLTPLPEVVVVVEMNTVNEGREAEYGDGAAHHLAGRRNQSGTREKRSRMARRLVQAQEHPGEPR